MPENSTTVTLTWQASSDDSGIKGYRIERSTDGAEWDELAAEHQTTAFSDDEVQFSARYFYRVAAIDAKGNISEFSITEITTNQFESNADEGNELRITTADGLVTFVLPADVFAEDVLCAAENYLSLGPSLEGYVTIGGPYELICKNSDGRRVTNFNNALRAHVQLTEGHNVSALEHYGLETNGWAQLEVEARDEAANVDVVRLGNTSVFTVMGKAKKASVIIAVFLVIIILICVALGVLYLLAWIDRRKRLQRYQDYYRKHHGL